MFCVLNVIYYYAVKRVNVLFVTCKAAVTVVIQCAGLQVCHSEEPPNAMAAVGFVITAEINGVIEYLEVPDKDIIVNSMITNNH